jgi:hypothetical protein
VVGSLDTSSERAIEGDDGKVITFTPKLLRNKGVDTMWFLRVF